MYLAMLVHKVASQQHFSSVTFVLYSLKSSFRLTASMISSYWLLVVSVSEYYPSFLVNDCRVAQWRPSYLRHSPT